MAYTETNGVILNKGLTIAQYNSKVASGEISSNAVATELFDLVDDLPVSQSEKDIWNAKSNFDGSYNSLTDKPTIPTVPTKVSAFTNDAGYITSIPGEYITEAELSSAISGKADSSAIPTKVSQLTNDSGYLTSIPSEYVTSTELSAVATSGSYNDLTNKPTIPDVSGFETKTDASAKLTEAKAYTDTKVADLVGTAPTTLDTLQEVAAAIQENESVVEALNSAIGNKANTSDLAVVATSGSYNDLTNKPTLFSGSYNDLSDKPTIPAVPTKVSAFTNDAGYLTTIPGEYVTSTELSAVATTGSYNDLSNKPTIYTAITKIWS